MLASALFFQTNSATALVESRSAHDKWLSPTLPKIQIWYSEASILRTRSPIIRQVDGSGALLPSRDASLVRFLPLTVLDVTRKTLITEALSY